MLRIQSLSPQFLATGLLVSTLGLAACNEKTQTTHQSANGIDYAKAENWLCLPGRDDSCATDLTATVVYSDGRTETEAFIEATDPAIDCFYVYPTVSLDSTGNSDMAAGEEEHKVVASQFARFASVCKTYAPLYRQITLTALRERITTGGEAGDGALAFADVENAFDHYLQHHNDGRPFVLIGHSQGSRMLTTLMQKRLDRQPLEHNMLSALLIGAPVETKIGSDRGGSFQHIPSCQSASQTGCVVAYASFRENSPPPSHSLFGKASAADKQALCTNPAALGSDELAEANAYLGNLGAGDSSIPATPWTSTGPNIDTPFVKVPGLLSTRCVNNENGSYLALTVNADPEDPRVDDIVGDVYLSGKISKAWGLHLVDISIVQGDLIALLQTQMKTWRAEQQ